MACNILENVFQSVQTIAVTIQKNGTTASLYLQNQGKNIAEIKRILIYFTTGSGGILLALRPGYVLPTIYTNPFLEPGNTALYYQLTNVAPGTIVQAQAEYVEIASRSRSCITNF